MTNQIKIGLGVFFLLAVLLILSNLNQQKNKSSYDNIFQEDVSNIEKIIEILKNKGVNDGDVLLNFAGAVKQRKFSISDYVYINN